MQEKEDLHEFIDAAIGSYLGARAVQKGIPAAKQSIKKRIEISAAKSTARIERAKALRKAKQTEVGSKERKEALKQSKKLKQDLEKRIKKIETSKPKPEKKKKPLSRFRRQVKKSQSKLRKR